eukprot:1348800-Amorphochlora_amoeboformis.AAC.1
MSSYRQRGSLETPETTGDRSNRYYPVVPDTTPELPGSILEASSGFEEERKGGFEIVRKGSNVG